MSDKKYILLINILDNIANNTPEKLGIYHPEENDTDAEIHKRSRSFIHLFLKVRFGILDFDVAESFITDGTNDGGLDAYYIDEEDKKIYLIQSKFSATSENFENNSVNGYELFRMELDRITKGEQTANNGNRYNGKIIDFQQKIKVENMPDISRYQWILLYVGNVSRRLNKEQLLSVSGGVCTEAEVINGKIFYNDILMPYLQHDFFNKKDFVLKIKVNQNQSNRINYRVNLDNDIHASVHLSFVPTKEIAGMMSKYRNSLLRHNPRCYVGIQRGGVNNAIKESMIDTPLNEFSLLNNGITIICSDYTYTENAGESGVAILQITNPQIVNGGQTAFTLAHILETNTDENFFENKEVLTKFILVPDNDDRILLIDKISKATNNQTPVNIGDRRSNDVELVNLQNQFFDKYGLLLERKRGQFYDSLQKGLVQKKEVLSSELLMRLLLVYRGEVARARSSGNDTMFKSYSLDGVDYDKLYLIVDVYRKINNLEQDTTNQRDRYRVEEWGNGLKYGKLAITYIIFKLINSIDEIDEKLELVKSKWIDFETTVSNHEHNENYYSDGFDYANYYKGRTINEDLNNYLEQL
jgi:hypothetical protein